MHAMHMEGIRLIHGFELGEGEAERIEALSLMVIEPRTSLNRQFAPETARIYGNAAQGQAAEDSGARGDIEYGFDADGSFRFTLVPGQVTPGAATALRPSLPRGITTPCATPWAALY